MRLVEGGLSCPSLSSPPAIAYSLRSLLGIALYARLRRAFRSTCARPGRRCSRTRPRFLRGLVLLLFFAIATHIALVHLALAATGGGHVDIRAGRRRCGVFTRTLPLLDVLLTGPRESVERTYRCPGHAPVLRLSIRRRQDGARVPAVWPTARPAPEGHDHRMAARRADALGRGAISGRCCRPAVGWLHGAWAGVGGAGYWRGVRRDLARAHPLPVEGCAADAERDGAGLPAGSPRCGRTTTSSWAPDQTGNDALFQAIKPIRTAVVIGRWPRWPRCRWPCCSACLRGTSRAGWMIWIPVPLHGAVVDLPRCC